MENNFSLVHLSFSNNLYNSVALPCRVLCNWILDHDASFLVSSVVFGADMWTTIGHQSYIHDAYISLHITLIITIILCVYCNFYIIYRIFVNTAMRQTTSFEAL